MFNIHLKNIFKIMKNSFEVIARALILKNNKILICKRKDRDYYFLPGGHVEFGETTKEAIIREIKEERDRTLKNVSFIGIVENNYEEESIKRHEINIIFEAEEEEKEKSMSAEDHLIFEFLDYNGFKEKNIKPEILKTKIIEYINDKKIFWGFQNLK